MSTLPCCRKASRLADRVGTQLILVAPSFFAMYLATSMSKPAYCPAESCSPRPGWSGLTPMVSVLSSLALSTMEWPPPPPLLLLLLLLPPHADIPALSMADAATTTAILRAFPVGSSAWLDEPPPPRLNA